VAAAWLGAVEVKSYLNCALKFGFWTGDTPPTQFYDPVNWTKMEINSQKQETDDLPSNIEGSVGELLASVRERAMRCGGPANGIGDKADGGGGSNAIAWAAEAVSLRASPNRPVRTGSGTAAGMAAVCDRRTASAGCCGAVCDRRTGSAGCCGSCWLPP